MEFLLEALGLQQLLWVRGWRLQRSPGEVLWQVENQLQAKEKPTSTKTRKFNGWCNTLRLDLVVVLVAGKRAPEY